MSGLIIRRKFDNFHTEVSWHVFLFIIIIDSCLQLFFIKKKKRQIKEQQNWHVPSSLLSIE